MAILNRQARQEKKRLKEEAEEQKRQNKISEYQIKIDVAKSEMLTKPCPFVQGNCNDDCIHFQHGRVYNDHFVGHLGVDTWIAFDLPRCKLWKD